MSVLRVKRVFVEPSLCGAFSLCEAEAPKGFIKIEHFESVDGDVAKVKQDHVPKTKDALLALLEAAYICPLDAFHIELASGEIVPVADSNIQRKVNSKQIEWA